MFGVSPEIDGSRVKDVLDVGAELIFALGAGRDRKQEEQGKEGVSIDAFHMNVGAKAVPGKGGLWQKSAPEATGLSTKGTCGGLIVLRALGATRRSSLLLYPPTAGMV